MSGPSATQESASRGWALLHDESLDPQRLPADAGLELVPYADREQVLPESRVLLWLGDERLREVAPLVIERSWCVGLLPHPDARHALAALGIKGEMRDLLRYYREAPEMEVDALSCNGELIFSSVVMGRVLALRPVDVNQPQTFWSTLHGALRNLGHLQLHSYRLATAKEKVVQMGALGLVALGNTQSNLVHRSFKEHITLNDGMVSLLVLAPRSIISYLLFILRLLLPLKFSLARLPHSVALVRSERITVTSPDGVEYLLDGKPVHAEEVCFELMPGRLRLLPGPALRRDPDGSRASGKETVKLNEVPVDDGAKALLGKSLPLFSHATESEYRDLFSTLRDSATASASFNVLMVLSVLLALTGLYADSAPVIIGAMVLAPLMSPVVSLGMALARSDKTLIVASLRTMLVGTLLGLGCGVVFSWWMPLELPTEEMRARMSPTLLDLLVAVLSGVAGAYGSAREDIAKGLAGVAIAVALVPPLGVAGIGLGWGDWNMAWGAGLLFLTNLVGIALAGSCTFLVLGFAPFHRARAGLGLTLVAMLLITMPLYIAFRHLVERDAILEQIPTGEVVLAGAPVRVSDPRVTWDSPHRVSVTLSAREPIDYVHVDALKQLIEQRVGQSIELEAQLNLRR